MVPRSVTQAWRQPPLSQFFHDCIHGFRGEKLPFFHVDGATGFGGCEKQIGLAAEKGGNLEDVDHPGGEPGFFRGMNIGEDWHLEDPLDCGQLLQPPLKAGSTGEETEVRLALS